MGDEDKRALFETLLITDIEGGKRLVKGTKALSTPLTASICTIDYNSFSFFTLNVCGLSIVLSCPKQGCCLLLLYKGTQ